VIVAPRFASATTIKEFRRFSQEQQAVFVSGAVSMAAYTYASTGDVSKARCVRQWYFGKRGEETAGPRELAVEIGVAEQRDPEKYHVEGVILGLTDKMCFQTTESSTPSP
jgi:hypothetical protein